MQSNNNGSALLLEWINQERTHQALPLTLYDFQHLKTTGFLYGLLQKVNPSYFLALNHLSFDLESYLKALEEYLIEVEGKKIVRAYKKDMVESQSIEEMVKLVLCLLLQGEGKGDYIERIVGMRVEVQSYLMQEIQAVSTCMENFIEIKDILTTVERLEEENELLKDSIRASTENTEQLVQEIKEAKVERNRIETDVCRYETEKKQVFEELQIVDMKEYVELYRLIKQENGELNGCIQDMEEGKKEAQGENLQMRERINEDYLTIDHLSQEVVALRNHYANAKEEANCLSLSYDNQTDSFDDNVLRENKNIGNVKVRGSLETTCSEQNSMFLSHTFEEEENSENEKLRAYNLEIMNKLDSAYQTVTQLTDEVSGFRLERERMLKKNSFLEGKLGDLKKEHKRFMKQIQTMGF